MKNWQKTRNYRRIKGENEEIVANIITVDGVDGWSRTMYIWSMELLALIDTTIRPSAQVSQVAIEDNQVVISFSGVTLAQAADLVVQLEQSPLVANTQVDTASSKEGSDQVEVHIYFQVAQEESAP